MKNKIETQSVRSTITFPLGQDEIAITWALQDLLKEGWELVELTKTKVSIGRGWKYTPELGQNEKEIT